MRRWSFHLLSLLCVLAFLALAALWIRSYFAWDCFQFTRGKTLFCFQTTRPGSADIATVGDTAFIPPQIVSGRYGPGTVRGTNGFDNMRFHVFNLGVGWPRPGQRDFYWIRLPLWLMMLLCIPFPLWWIRYCRTPRHLPGHCKKCGYDLRASKNRCPECGTPIPLPLNLET
jgi:hypothetical protein